MRRAWIAIVLALGAAAPTAGDVGSCSEPAEDLDAGKFFAKKRGIECARCSECGVATRACGAACAPGGGADAFPEGCYPLIHDGEVCLNALDAASCGDFAETMSDTAPTVPTECNFCPADEVER